mmetsp:Transcript_30785/g.117809  ORF Transcript_30785/g.117809 Transcript_30785/m.117809 type:complete len:90 (-) Transcript_30785:302-571(-)
MARAGGVWCSLVLDRERRSIVKALEILLIGMAEVMENVVTSEEVEKAVNANSSPRPEKPRFEKAKARDGKVRGINSIERRLPANARLRV